MKRGVVYSLGNPGPDCPSPNKPGANKFWQTLESQKKENAAPSGFCRARKKTLGPREQIRAQKDPLLSWSKKPEGRNHLKETIGGTPGLGKNN